MAFVELKNVGKSYGSGDTASEVLKDINLSIEDGEFVAIVGFSGSGKTTLISILAGLIAPDAGEALFRGAPISGAGPERGVVFQSYSLFPWMTVYANIALAVAAVFKKEGKAARDERVRKYIDLVGLTHAIERRPSELSGGMRQRVAVARALAMNPQILLLDEPLSALDALTRSNLQDEIERIWEQERKTVVLITNDVDEAILLADRIIPLNPGPQATLGPEFKVDIPRPRDRAAMNHDKTFQAVRRDVTQYLIDIGISSNTTSDTTLNLPDVQPIMPGKRLPKAAKAAAAAHFGNADKYVEFSHIDKVYPTAKGPLTVVEDFDLTLRKGEFVSVIGHSGCGKSTVLTMAAGLNEITRGGIILDGGEIADAGPDRGVVFQAPSLFPWLSARENVALGVDRVYRHAGAGERAEIVDYYLTRVGLGDALDKPARDMSGGMRQRVGIARAFALSPKFLLLDEPFGMLDSLTRWELQEVLMDVWKRTQVTAMCVTHDVDEAILLADRVIMMSNGPRATIGKILDVDLPRPRTRKALLAHPRYYALREEVLTFLQEHEHGEKTAVPRENAAPGLKTTSSSKEAA
ncbi:ABC transporter ATP-binding protein [Varunaivibrio sulfuroxidans]|uniref:Nitrate/nitrite transport system ATP-binding protein n=1 Tax=Varunaivibrio sulfuroxidans TaxID=1773489 RepID=A0A4R3J9A4_9PROT|nr:ABC transporter ATP-binding protein [Varunaivibrio sulfuroxidans]TCS62529.1 nitrate/nitrite transport system ATP-binding protein [Varunaivibrio sulfuroxidans]WES30800.1 ABC transporter ATP-binding protein [Varunaivibrio sulfuroxidans]